jgi:hypothetical protein
MWLSPQSGPESKPVWVLTILFAQYARGDPTPLSSLKKIDDCEFKETLTSLLPLKEVPRSITWGREINVLYVIYIIFKNPITNHQLVKPGSLKIPIINALRPSILSDTIKLINSDITANF